MKKDLSIKIISFGVFCLLFAVGIILAERKPLWNDELYSQTYGVEKLSFLQILDGRILEGNNCPLFYVLQKGLCRVFQYKFPLSWNGDWNLSDPTGQILLRFFPNLFMSLAIVLIFYYFSRAYSLWAGGYALLVSLSSFMVWAYWAEARPYSQWIFLTTAQVLLFLRIASCEKEDMQRKQAWRSLGAVHLLLALTVVAGMGQIVFVSILLWFLGERKGKRYIFVTGLPVAIGLFYSARAGKYNFLIPKDFMGLIYENFPLERVCLVLVYAFLAVWFYRSAKARQKYLLGEKETALHRVGIHTLILTALMFLLTFVLLGLIQLISRSDKPGFDMPSRYFIYLTPVGIVAAVLVSVHFVRAFKKDPWILANGAIVLGGLLILGFLKTFQELINQRLY